MMNFLHFSNFGSPGRRHLRALPTGRVLLGVILAAFAIGFFSDTGRAETQFVGAFLLRAEKFFTESAGAVHNAFLTDTAKLAEENRALKKRLGEGNAKLWSYALLEKENRELKALLGRGTEAGYETIAAAVLAGPPRSPYGTLLIDAGLLHDVLEGDDVFLSGDIALGTIIEVLRDTAKVSLYSAAGAETEAVLGDAAFPVRARGRGSGEFEISVPRGLALTEGDLLRLPGTEPRILGVVQTIEDRPTDSFIRVLAAIPANIQTLGYVGVRKPGAGAEPDTKPATLNKMTTPEEQEIKNEEE